MKKIMTMMLAVVPFGMMGQSAQEVYALTDDIFNMSYAEAGNALTEEVNHTDVPILAVLTEEIYADDMLIVDDLLLADPDFDIQENMISYTKDQKTVYFSANRKLKVKKANDLDVKIKKSVQLQMFKASVKENGEWTNLEMLPFNGKNHSTGYPALNNDETKLYFVADGPGSTGKTDLFMVDLREEGSYGKPENLGSKINTEERELSPFVDDSNVLYFASDVETAGAELNVFASELIDNKPSTRIKLDVQATGSKEDYIAAYKAVDAEALMLAEKEADLKDLEILQEAESLANIARIEENFKGTLSGAAYDFSSERIIYTVQIGAFLKNIKTSDYKDSSVLFNHRYDDGYNRFYSGVFASVDDALAHLEQMKKEGYDDAFVLGLTGKNRFLTE